MIPSSDQSRPRRRDYEKLLLGLESRWKRRPSDRAKLMQEIVEGLWDSLRDKIISWCGFFVVNPDGETLSLGLRCDGEMGRALSDELALRALSDRQTRISPSGEPSGFSREAEIAIPVADPDGKVFAVLGVKAVGAAVFGEEDRRWLERLVKALGQAPAPGRGP